MMNVYYIKGKYPVFTTFLNLSTHEISNIKENITNYRKKSPKSNKRISAHFENQFAALI